MADVEYSFLRDAEPCLFVGIDGADICFILLHPNGARTERSGFLDDAGKRAAADAAPLQFGQDIELVQLYARVGFHLKRKEASGGVFGVFDYLPRNPPLHFGADLLLRVHPIEHELDLLAANYRRITRPPDRLCQAAQNWNVCSRRRAEIHEAFSAPA